jgi:hypothetical protein
LIRRASLAAILCGVQAPALPSDGPVYVTWVGFEPDKCASVWFIKRYVAPEAQILFFEPESRPPAGILFDTPDADLKRTHNKSTFEALLDHQGLSDAALDYIGRLIHDMEINTWRRKALPETRRVESELGDLLAGRGPQEAVRICLDYFDALLADQE